MMMTCYDSTDSIDSINNDDSIDIYMIKTTHRYQYTVPYYH